MNRLLKAAWTIAIPVALCTAGSAAIGAQDQLTLPKVRPIPDVLDPNPAYRDPGFVHGRIHALPVRGNVWMLSAEDANIAIQVGPEGVFVVDTLSPDLISDVVGAVRRIADDPVIRSLVNTSIHHVEGNEAFSNAGSRISIPQGGNFVVGVGAPIRGHMNLYTMMSAGVGGKPAFSFDSWPSETFITDRKDFWFNGEAVEMIRIPAAYSDADLIVHIRKSDVVVAGDIYVKNGYPVIDIERGGSINGLIAGLNQIIDITVPEYKQEGGTMVIPGHGRLSNEADVVDYRDMVTIIRDRIQDLIGKGRTLDQVKATRPTLDYDGYYGSSNPSWTSEKFIEAVYRSLSETGRTSSSR